MQVKAETFEKSNGDDHLTPIRWTKCLPAEDRKSLCDAMKCPTKPYSVFNRKVLSMAKGFHLDWINLHEISGATPQPSATCPVLGSRRWLLLDSEAECKAEEEPDHWTPSELPPFFQVCDCGGKKRHLG